MKKLLISHLAAILCLSAQAQTAWIRHFNSDNYLYSIQLQPGGYAFLASDGIEIYQQRVDFAGQPLGKVVLGSVPEDVVEASDGSFYKVYHQDYNLRLQKLDAGGVLLWQQILPDSVYSQYLRLASLPDGGCYLAVMTPSTPGSPYPKTTLRRLNANGDLLWQRDTDPLTGWGTLAQRRITDVITLPDSSCVVFTTDYVDGYHGSAHLSQTKPDGTPGFSIGHDYTWSFSNGAEYRLAQPVGDSSLLALGQIVSSSGGLHPLNTSKGFVMQADWENGVLKQQETDYPPTVSQMGATYGPTPIAATPLANGDMAVVIKQASASRIWRGNPNLKDTAWERNFDQNAEYFEWNIERINRVFYATPDGGAILGGVDVEGVFLMKMGPWGNDTTLFTQQVKGRVVEDTDFDCNTAGPYAPLKGARVRFTSVENPAHRWWANTDAAGQVNAPLYAGHWRVSVADSVDAAYGASCLPEILLTVSDTLPAPEFELPVLRYKARIAGRVGFDNNADCLFDGGNYTGPEIIFTKAGQQYSITPDLQGYFSVAVDTGRYQLQLKGYTPGLFQGYYCQPTEVYLPDYQSSDTVNLLWSRLKDCNMRVITRRDADYNCSPTAGDESWPYFPLLMKDAASGEEAVVVADLFGVADKPIYGSGEVQVGFLLPFGDSLICTPGTIHNFLFSAGITNQLRYDTLVGKLPRLEDSLSICSNEWIFGQMLTKDTTLKTTEYYLHYGPWNYLPVEVTHHISVRPFYLVQVYVVDSTLASDSLVSLYYVAENGCDSSVFIHYLTVATRDLAASRMQVWPNPTSGVVQLQFPQTDVEKLLVMDMQGRVLMQVALPLGLDGGKFSLEGLPKGVYVLKGCRRNGGYLVGRVVLK